MPTQEETAATIAAHAVRGHRTALFAHGVRVLCKIVAVLALARLVTPADHGLYAMAASVTLLLTVFRDLGLGAAALQAAHLDEETETALWWAHLTLGGSLALLTLALAPVAIWFYEDSRLGPLLALMSLSFVFLGANGWPRVLLARRLQFVTLSRLETNAVLLATGAMIAAGAAGAGAYAFAIFLLIFEGSLMVTAWRASEWRPQTPGRWAKLTSLLPAGFALTGFHLILYLSVQVETLAIGKWFGPRLLGLYNRSAQLLLLPTLHIANPLGQVLLAALTRMDHDAPEFRAQIRDTAGLVLHLTLPLTAVCIVLPTETARLVLGEQWLEAAPFLRWLAVGGAVAAMTATLHPVSVALARTRRLVLTAVATLAAMVAALFLARSHGPVAIAQALALTHVLLVVPRLWWIVRGSPLRLSDYVSAFIGPFALSAAWSAGLYGAAVTLPGSAWWIRLGAGCASGVFAVVVLCAVAPTLRRELRHVWSHRPRWNELDAREATP